MTYLVLLWLCQSQMWEAWPTGRPVGRPGATGCTLMTPKRSCHGSCASRSDKSPPCNNNKVKATLMSSAAEQMLEMRSRAWNEKVRDAQQVVSNPSPVMPNSLSALRGFWSSPHPCHHMNIYLGAAGRGFCYFIPFAFCFSFCLSFQRCGLTAVTGVNRHWPLPCGQDIILLSLAQWRSSGHKIIRAPPCQRCKERQPPNPGERHHLRWQTLYCNHSRPGNKIMS